MVTTNWRLKAIAKTAEIRKLKKKIKELEASRTEWKQKSISHKSHADTLEAKFIRMKDNITKVLNETT